MRVRIRVRIIVRIRARFRKYIFFYQIAVQRYITKNKGRRNLVLFSYWKELDSPSV
jgi:hypothetical protein